MSDSSAIAAAIHEVEAPQAILPARVTAPRQSKRLADYQLRKESGRCVYPRCDKLAADDSVWCPAHRDYHRKAGRDSKVRVRAELREAGKCVDCRRRSQTYRCPVCRAKLGDIPPSKTVLKDVQNERSSHYRIDPAARGRKEVPRYVGRSRRGAPSAALLDDQDLDEALDEVRKAKEALAYSRSDEVKAMPKIQRDGILRAALGRVERASRWLDEVLARHNSL